MRFLAALPLLLLAPAATDASAQTGCTRSVVKVALADGKEMPHVIVECPGAESQGLLAADAIEKACAGAGDPSQPPGTLEACERAVANAQQALRKAKIPLRGTIRSEALARRCRFLLRGRRVHRHDRVLAITLTI